jgi:predicted unusual protein kinase regulating ubiquinone biosynthesis (AarF/ABC1/UbiB family)
MDHRDLHSGNVMVNKDSLGAFTVAISDLGRMVEINTPITKGARSERKAKAYRETYKQHPYEYSFGVGYFTHEADIFSLCRILLEYFIKIDESSPETLRMSEELVHLLKTRGLHKVASNRPTLAKLIKDLRSLIAVRQCVLMYVCV